MNNTTADSPTPTPRRRGRPPLGVKTRVEQTARDALMLCWIADQYGLPMDLVRRLAALAQQQDPTRRARTAGPEVSKQAANNLVKRWCDAGWADRGQVDVGEGWVWVRPAVVRQLVGYDVPAVRPKPTTSGHTRAVAAYRLHAAGASLDRWVSERAWRSEAGWRKAGQTGHVPDGILTEPDGSRWLIEVELSMKTPGRWEAVTKECAAIVAQRGLTGVRYVTTETLAHRLGEIFRRRVAEEQHRPQPVRWDMKNIKEVPGWSNGFYEERQRG